MTEEEVRLEPGRRPDIEAELDKHQVDWRFIAGVKPGQFNLAESLKNQARFEPLDQPTVDSYTECVKRGDHFPAVMAYRPNKGGRYTIIDGNHRLSAHTAANALLDVYEIDKDTDPHMIALLTFIANVHHGRPTSEEERVHQAIWLVDSGASIENAATAVSIPVRALRRALTRAKADVRADEVGLRRNEWDALSSTIKSRLNGTSTDEGFRAAANLTYQAKLDVKEVETLVEQLNVSKSGVRQEELVKATRDLYQRRVQAGGGGVLHTAHSRKLSSKDRANMVVGQALALPEDYQSIASQYAEPERASASKRLHEAGTRLLTLADLLAPTRR